MNYLKKIIKWPSKEELIADETEFRKLTIFPGAIGAIDGCHIEKKAPNETQADYLDRKCNHTVNLLAICNSKKQFIFIDVGFPGSAHDSRVLNCSGFLENLESNKDDLLPNGDYHIIGDSAFPLSRYLLVPFKDYGNLSPKQIKFNKALSKTWVLIENTVGLLKCRFKRLFYIDAEIKNIYKIVAACCVLHNLCLNFPENTIEENYVFDELLNIYEGVEEVAGTSYRDYLLNMYFNI